MNKSRGNRRAKPLVERDQVILAEKKLTENKSMATAGAELGLPPRTAQRLAAQGLREMLNTPANKLKLEALFSVFISGFAESLEDLQIVIDNYKSRGKLPPIKAVLAKVTTLLAAAKTCGLGNDNTVIQTGETIAPVEISFNVVGRRGELEKLTMEEFGKRGSDVFPPRAPRQLMAAPDLATTPEPGEAARQCTHVGTLESETSREVTTSIPAVEPQIIPPTPVDDCADDPIWYRPIPGMPRMLRKVPLSPPVETHRQKQIRLQMEENGGSLTLRGRKNIEGSGIEDLG